MNPSKKFKMYFDIVTDFSNKEIWNIGWCVFFSKRHLFKWIQTLSCLCNVSSISFSEISDEIYIKIKTLFFIHPYSSLYQNIFGATGYILFLHWTCKSNICYFITEQLIVWIAIGFKVKYKNDCVDFILISHYFEQEIKNPL